MHIVTTRCKQTNLLDRHRSSHGLRAASSTSPSGSRAVARAGCFARAPRWRRAAATPGARSGPRESCRYAAQREADGVERSSSRRLDGGWLESCAIIIAGDEQGGRARSGRRSTAEPAAHATNVYRTVAPVKWRIRARATGRWSPSCCGRRLHPSSPTTRCCLGLDDDATRAPVLVHLVGSARRRTGRRRDRARGARATLSADPRKLRARRCSACARGWSSSTAITRTRCSDSFIGPALMTGSRVLLVRSRRTRRDVSELAATARLRVAEMPMEHEPLTRLLHQMLA